MSLPINRKVFDPSLLDSLTRVLSERPNELLQSPLADLLTASQTMSIRQRSNESFGRFMDELSPAELYQREKTETLIRYQMMYEARPVVMSQSVLESLNRDMGTRVNEVISASLAVSTPTVPSPSSTDPSNLSGASLMTSFLSRTSAKNSGSNPSSSRSGPPKLLSSPSKAIATKNFSQS